MEHYNRVFKISDAASNDVYEALCLAVKRATALHDFAAARAALGCRPLTAAQAELAYTQWLNDAQRAEVSIEPYEPKGDPEKLSEGELLTLHLTTCEEEWNALCDEVKFARHDAYPADWFRTMLASGLIAAIQRSWKSSVRDSDDAASHSS